MARKRRLWKNYYIQEDSERRRLQACWQSFGDKKHTMVFERGFMETNLPLAALRDLFAWADVETVRVNDYVSDVKPSWEEEPPPSN